VTASAAAAVRNIAAGKFTLFPRGPKPKSTNQHSTNRAEQQQQDDTAAEERTQQPPKQERQATSALPMPWSSSASGPGVGPRMGMGRQQQGPGKGQRFGQGQQGGGQGQQSNGQGQQGGQRGSLPSLERWLREGTDVSPFSTLKKP
jgi:hypothetical protein